MTARKESIIGKYLLSVWLYMYEYSIKIKSSNSLYQFDINFTVL